MQIIDYIPQDATPVQLMNIVNMLADEVNKWRNASAQYEAELSLARSNYKTAFAKAKVIHSDKKVASIINAYAETEPLVLAESEKVNAIESKYILANGKYEGVLAQYQAVKHNINLKIQELRTFNG